MNVDQHYRDAVAAALTYDHVGSSLHRPPTAERVLGTGEAALAEARDRLRQWAAHRAIGARIHPAQAPIEEGQTVLVLLGLGPLRIVAPTRIVAVVDRPDAFGFAYGTLPGHPERGEESFVIRRGDDGAVTASIAIDAVPAWRSARLAAPAVRALQRLAVAGYLRGLAPR